MLKLLRCLQLLTDSIRTDCHVPHLEGSPVVADVQVMLQVGNEGLADDNIIRAGVVVQLLVPLLHHSSLQLHSCVRGSDIMPPCSSTDG